MPTTLIVYDSVTPEIAYKFIIIKLSSVIVYDSVTPEIAYKFIKTFLKYSTKCNTSIN